MAAAITVKDVHVKYHSVKSMSIRRAVSGKRDSQYVHALKGVSFEVEKGEIVGVLGSNGGGKSTLLRTIAGVFVPDSGCVDLHGNSCSLLAIGVGFVQNLSGRENIMLSGMLLGFTKKQIQDKMDDIIEYSELGNFIDLPVRTYSSGMYSKLAFSITATLKTDVLLIDEVLSVGDEQFKKKSFETMKALIRDEDRTVVIVSHSLEQLRELCSRVIWLEHGEIIEIGTPDEIIKKYRG